MTDIPTAPPSGTRDFLAPDVLSRRQVFETIRTTYESFGFEPLETPAYERLETLLGKYGEQEDKLIFKLLKRGQKLERALDSDEPERLADLGLRFDLTVPLARVVAEHQNRLPRHYKRYQIAPVWRADRPQKGRYREFYQCDVDIVGTETMTAEAQLADAVTRALHRLGLQDFTIHANHRQLLEAMLEFAEVPQKLHSEALIAIDKLDKIGAEGVRSELAERGIDGDSIDKLDDLVDFASEVTRGAEANAETLSKLQAQLSESDKAMASLDELDHVLALTRDGPADDHIAIDPSLGRGLSYYTGPIFEIQTPDFDGSIGGGGRYDDLIGMFAGRSYPACGFSLGVERILVLMEQKQLLDADKGTADVLVTLWNEDFAENSMRLARKLRAENIRVDLYSEGDGLGKQFGYADRQNIPYVAILAPDEIEQDIVSMKEMESGEQYAVPRSKIGEWVRDHI